MADDTTTLTITARAPEGSRATRRLRRAGLVPGVLYGGGADPVPFAVGARELRHALHASGAVVELSLDGASTPAVLKDSQRNPVRGETTHVDFIRVDLTKPIEAVVPVELLGGDDAPGVKEAGVLDQQLREVTVEALPTSIPESITVDVSAMKIGDVLTLAAAQAPSGVRIVDEPDAVVATVLAPRLREEGEEGSEIEVETQVVGESSGDAEAGAGESGDKE